MVAITQYLIASSSPLGMELTVINGDEKLLWGPVTPTNEPQNLESGSRATGVLYQNVD